MTARNFGLHTRDTMAVWPQAAEEQDDVPGRGIVWACVLSAAFWTVVGLLWWAVH